jgi:hypothetical protein
MADGEVLVQGCLVLIAWTFTSLLVAGNLLRNLLRWMEISTAHRSEGMHTMTTRQYQVIVYRDPDDEV